MHQLTATDTDAYGDVSAASSVSNAVIVSQASSDFFDDGKSDILFRNTSSGQTYLWQMNGGTVSSTAVTSTQVGTNWQVEGVGDFNGDGKSDLLWVYNNAANASDPLNGTNYITLQNGATAISGSGAVQQLSSAWQVAGVGDFNGDGKSDLLYRNSSTGQTYIDIMNGAQVNSSASGLTSMQQTNLNWSVAAVADFNGDGETDVLWRYNNASNASDPLNGALYEWQMNGTTVTNSGLLSVEPGSANWQVAGTGDFNGNGDADILLRYQNLGNAADPLNGMTYIDFMNGTTVTSGAPTQWQVNNSWNIASIGDYNGDGKSDILFQQGSTGNTYMWEMNGANVTTGVFTSQQAGTTSAVQNGVHISG